MDNIQLCYIDNEINKIDKMKQGDVIYKNGMELLVVLSYDHNEPCKGCFFYKNKACGSEKLIKCWEERHINGIGYGSLLPTVQTQGLKVCDKDGKTRFMDLSSLPKQGIKYGDLLPTPVASDHTGSCTIRKMTKSNGAPRTDSLRNMPAVIGMDGDRLNGRVFQLSPLFVEEMMGYPLMWTTLPFLTGNGEKNQ